MSDKRIVLVTGANKGIGLAIVKALSAHPSNFHVLLGSRDLGQGNAAAEKLGLSNVEVVQLDVADHASIERAVTDILKKHKKIDVLINNAATFGAWSESFLNSNFDQIRNTFDVNTLGPLKLCQLIVPVMKENKYGRIVNVSSGAGQISDMNGCAVPYRLSKVSMNALTKIMNDELLKENIIVNSMCPGSVKTDMNPNGKKSPEEAAETAVYLATLEDNGPRGQFFRDKKQIPF